MIFIPLICIPGVAMIRYFGYCTYKSRGAAAIDMDEDEPTGTIVHNLSRIPLTSDEEAPGRLKDDNDEVIWGNMWQSLSILYILHLLPVVEFLREILLFFQTALFDLYVTIRLYSQPVEVIYYNPSNCFLETTIRCEIFFFHVTFQKFAFYVNCERFWAVTHELTRTFRRFTLGAMACRLWIFRLFGENVLLLTSKTPT